MTKTTIAALFLNNTYWVQIWRLVKNCRYRCPARRRSVDVLCQMTPTRTMRQTLIITIKYKKHTIVATHCCAVTNTRSLVKRLVRGLTWPIFASLPVRNLIICHCQATCNRFCGPFCITMWLNCKRAIIITMVTTTTTIIWILTAITKMTTSNYSKQPSKILAMSRTAFLFCLPVCGLITSNVLYS